MSKELKKIWDKLENVDERLLHLESLFSKTRDINKIGNEYESLVTETGIELEKLMNIVYFEEGIFKIITEIDGENHKERQLIATLLILTIHKICYGIHKVRSQDLKNMLEYLGIGSLVNLSTNLKTCKNYIISDGKKSSHEYGYKLTLPGKREGIRILSDLSKKER